MWWSHANQSSHTLQHQHHSYRPSRGIFLFFFKGISHETERCNQRAHSPWLPSLLADAGLAASQSQGSPSKNTSLPAFTRWDPLEMPSVCLSPVCHVLRLDQVIAAGTSPVSAASLFFHASPHHPVLFQCPSVGFRQRFLTPSSWFP